MEGEAKKIDENTLMMTIENKQVVERKTLIAKRKALEKNIEDVNEMISILDTE